MNTCHQMTAGVALAAVVLAGGAIAQDRDEVSGAYSFTPGSLLELDLVDGGSAEIVGWEKDQAEVVYSDRYGEVDDFDISVREIDGGLAIRAEMKPRRRKSNALSFEIRVPVRVNVKLHSAGGGFEFENLDGTFEGTTGGGGFVLQDVDGDVHLRTGGGPIRVEDCELDGKITTGGGEVLIENVVGNLSASSGGGNVRYANVRDRNGQLRGPDRHRTDGATGETVLIDSAGGDIEIDAAPAGARLQTGGGAIHVRQASRFVFAKTGGGEIDVQVDDGWVEATTGAGDIHVEVESGLGDGGEGIDLFSGHGDITVDLPEGLSMDVDLEIQYTRSMRKRLEITSDLQLDRDESDEWDYDHGSPRKYIWGHATIGGGRHRVKISTVNGDIEVRVRD